MRYLMGVDNGGTFSKAAIFDELGNQIASASERTEVLAPTPGYAERDLKELWNVNARVIKNAIKKSGLDPKTIVGVSFSGHGKGLYLLDKAGNPLGNGILSMDTRAQNIVEQWRQNSIARNVSEKTKQPILACQPPALLAFIKQNSPQIYNQIGCILAVKDYIRYQLTGKANGEYGDFSGGNLINFHTKSYDLELMKLYGLEDLMPALPELVYAGDMCGTVTKQAAEKTGLVEGTAVAAGMFDIDACGLASGLTTEDKLAMIAGTWSINEYIAKNPVESKTTLNSFYAIPGFYLIEESSPTSAGNMEWFLRHILDQEEKTAKAEGTNIYDVINDLVASVDPKESKVTYLPYLNGSPDAEQATGTFIGLTLGTEKKHMLRAVYEGVVFSHKYHLDRLLQHRNLPASIQLSGGAANSAVWAQMFADILEVPVEVVADKELGALGAAMAAGVASGVYSSLEEAAKTCVVLDQKILPRPDLANIYQKKYSRFLRLLESLKEVWKELD